jgi:hypothetical protein
VCHGAETSQKGDGRLGLGRQTTAIHTDGQMHKEKSVRLRLTQEHDLGSRASRLGRHSHAAVPPIEPPKLLRRTPVVACQGGPRGGSVFWLGALPGPFSLANFWK